MNPAINDQGIGLCQTIDCDEYEGEGICKKTQRRTLITVCETWLLDLISQKDKMEAELDDAMATIRKLSSTIGRVGYNLRQAHLTLKRGEMNHYKEENPE